jgi:asparagine synthase (glutamine-hydrolysing)
MCGISGFLLTHATLPGAAAESRLWAMIATLRHRGPDDEGVWNDDRAGLAHARLSIIDLSPAGHQPMGSADESVWITFNGEIYNFVEIRRELEAAGYPFRSRSDTEVIVNGWHAWGPKIFPRLHGMFALAIWDQRSQRLVLARDRIGKKPLYYTTTAEAFLFGSEIKALLAWPRVRRAPDLLAIDRYLTLGYVPAPYTAFAGVRKLSAAHYLMIDARSGGGFTEPEIIRYWRLPSPRATRQHRRVTDLQRELVAQLENAVRLRLVSDVPLGAFLSGGVDSSAVVAMMARIGSGTVKTFSIGFSARQYDETSYARMVAQRYSTEHQELVIEPDAVTVLPRLVWHYGEPFADPSAIPTYYVSEMARQKVTVALSGDGGDECFFGYNRYKAMRLVSRLDSIPRWSRTGIDRLLGLAPRSVQRRFKVPRIRGVLQAPKEQPCRRYALTIVAFTDCDKKDGYGELMRSQRESSALDLLEPYFAEADSLVEGANWADLHTYLPDDLMVKVDVASMAHGLESRSPLLDHVFMEWAAGIPEEIRMARGVTKALFKSAMSPYLPAEVLYRPKKGFGLPVDQWFRGDLRELAYDTLLSRISAERGLFRPEYVRLLLDEHSALARDHHTRLWSLLMLELWFQMWIDAPTKTEISRPAMGSVAGH